MIKLKQILTEITCKDAFDSFLKIKTIEVTNNLTLEKFSMDVSSYTPDSSNNKACTNGEGVGIMFKVSPLTIKDKEGKETKSKIDRDIFLSKIETILGTWKYISYPDELNTSNPDILKIYVTYSFQGPKAKAIGSEIGDSVSFEKIPNSNTFNDTMINFMLSWAVYNTAVEHEEEMQAKGGEYADYQLEIDPNNIYSFKITSYHTKPSTVSSDVPFSTGQTGYQKTNPNSTFPDQEDTAPGNTGGGRVSAKTRDAMDKARRERE